MAKAREESLEEYTQRQLAGRKYFSLTRLYRYGLAYWRQILLAFFLIVVAIVSTLIQPKIIQMLIDGEIKILLSKQLGEELKIAALKSGSIKALLYLVTVLINFVAGYFQALILQTTGQKILYTLRGELYEHILKLPMSYFDRHPQGSLVTRLTNDTESLNEMFSTVLSSLLRNILYLIGILVSMFLLNAHLALWISLLLPLIGLISYIFRKVIRKVYFGQRRLLSMINTKLSENIAGMKTIQIFNQEERIKNEFDSLSLDHLSLSQKEVTYFAVYRPSIDLIHSLALAGLVWYLGGSFLQGLVSFGILNAFIDYTRRFFEPIWELSEIYNLIQSGITSAARIFHLLDEPEEKTGEGIDFGQEGLKGELEFKHVYFAYKPGEWILEDVSFKVEPGQFVAFVGATGAGKSTIMHLLCRFYEIDAGQILIDGRDIKDYKLSYLRRQLGVVQQAVFLYSGSILSNISLKRPSVGLNESRKAAEIVNADKFIEKLPRRYDQYVTTKGSSLSAGQRQLLSFARTLAASPSILILDEATANIDSETEALIQSAIVKMAENRTMLAVAHRISTIADADHIILLKDGKIAEEGTCNELLARDGYFKILYELQYKEQLT